MEHYRSVFATAGLMVFALLAASPIVHSQGPDEARASTKAASTVEAAPSAWVEPPRYGAAAPEAAGEGGAPVRPASFTLLAPETLAALSAGAQTAPAASRIATATGQRQRAARASTRARPMVAARTPPAESGAAADAAQTPPEQKAARADPIGDLLRGLGIGRDS